MSTAQQTGKFRNCVIERCSKLPAPALGRGRHRALARVALGCLSPVICKRGIGPPSLETNFEEFSGSDAELVSGGVVRVSVVVTPRGILLVVHMANDRHPNQSEGCADD